MTERVLRASADAFVISPRAWVLLAPDPDRSPDTLSVQWLLALADRLLREVGQLVTGARGRRVATFAIDGELAFATAADRAAFTRELGEVTRALAARYHSDRGRPHRLVVALHPSLSPKEEET